MRDFVDDCYIVDVEEPGEDEVRALRLYVNEICGIPSDKTWFDNYTQKCFGNEQTWHNTPGKESFLALKDDFLDDPRWGAQYVSKYFGILNSEIHMSNELCCTQNSDLQNKLYGSKILIVGGGPSTNSADWNHNDYDYILTCNHFFLNKKLAASDNILLAFIGDEIDTNSKEFENYFINNDTFICFENVTKNPQEMLAAKEKYKNVVFAHTRYRSKIGSTPRLLVYASLFGPREIHIVGMDGRARGAKLGEVHGHAFEPAKVNQGTYNYDLYRHQYILLWDYVLGLAKNTKFVNLGDGHEMNMSTPITRKWLDEK